MPNESVVREAQQHALCGVVVQCRTGLRTYWGRKRKESKSGTRGAGAENGKGTEDHGYKRIMPMGLWPFFLAFSSFFLVFMNIFIVFIVSSIYSA